MSKDNGTENGVAVEFNMDALKSIKAKEMAYLLRGTNIEATAAVFARVVKSCPYGDPTNPDTYLELDYDNGTPDSFAGMMVALGEALKKGRTT